MALPKIETLEKMALQVDQELRLHGYLAALEAFEDVVFPEKKTDGALLPLNRSKTLALFEVVCEKMNLFSSLVVATLADVQNTTDAARSPSFNERLQMVDKEAAERFLEYAMTKQKWGFMETILQLKPKMQFPSVLNTLVHSFNSDPGVVPIIQSMLKRGFLKKHLLVNFLEFFIKVGNKSLFEFVVQNDLISLMEVKGSESPTDHQSENEHASVLSMIMKAMEELEERDKELNNMLAIAIETGVSTFHAALISQHTPQYAESPLKIAALNGRMNIVRLLYRSGATTNRELFELQEYLHRVCETSSGMEEQRDSDDIYRYLSCAARQPRRLKELCFLRISHMAGCRSMEARAKILNEMPRLTKDDPGQTSDSSVSYTLKDRVLFKDVLLDFKYGALHCAVSYRDPPEFWTKIPESDTFDDDILTDGSGSAEGISV